VSAHRIRKMCLIAETNGYCSIGKTEALNADQSYSALQTPAQYQPMGGLIERGSEGSGKVPVRQPHLASKPRNREVAIQIGMNIVEHPAGLGGRQSPLEPGRIHAVTPGTLKQMHGHCNAQRFSVHALGRDCKFGQNASRQVISDRVGNVAIRNELFGGRRRPPIEQPLYQT
jgi:hypothetical protein